MKNSSLPPAVWLASNCNARNKRSLLVIKLNEKGFVIDKFGRCGQPAPGCDGVGKQLDECVVELIRPYKFYFAMENTNCKDYVTEKFYKSLHPRMAVPIILSRKYYRDVGAPEDSYIAIDDFENLDEFTKRINQIANDKNLYLKYHKWREEYKVTLEHDDLTGFCELCRRLQLSIKEHKIYNDLENMPTNKATQLQTIVDAKRDLQNSKGTLGGLSKREQQTLLHDDRDKLTRTACKVTVSQLGLGSPDSYLTGGAGNILASLTKVFGLDPFDWMAYEESTHNAQLADSDHSDKLLYTSIMKAGEIFEEIGSKNLNYKSRKYQGVIKTTRDTDSLVESIGAFCK
ncbi:hypothetical protein WR25_23838 [Diploscapter pachys]|uniref:Fucosyltransferase n=1 Tax=Diploscapter pachys TaxID=2018661 RepID=A0A2A2J8M3_9BILA|nr:hypothetical protein WR25_23838 [Diploscapter pachys]